MNARLARGPIPRHCWPSCIKTALAGLLLAVFGVAATASDDIGVGDAEYARGSFAAALSAYARVTTDTPAEEIHLLLRKGRAYLALGRSDDALAAVRRAESLRVGQPALGAAIAGLRGSALLLAGARGEARPALEAAARADDNAVAANALHNLGNLAVGDGRPEAAPALYEQAIARARRGADPLLVARSHANLAKALRAADKSAAADASAAAALSEVAALPDSHAKAAILLNVGRQFAQATGAGASREAYEALSAAAAAADRLGDGRLQSYAQGYLGELYAVGDRPDDAETLNRRAIFRAQSANAPDILYRWQWQAGRLSGRRGDADAAIAAYRAAIATLQEVGRDVRSGVPNTLRESVRPLYYEQADLLLRRAAAADGEAAVETDLREARQTIELFKGVELEDYFQDDCVASLKARTTGIDALAEGTAALYPILFDDRAELLLSLPDGLHRYTVPLALDGLNRAVRALRAGLEKRTTHDYLAPAQALYDALIRPIEPALVAAEVNTIVFIPDGALRTIPLATLHDGERFLIERFAVASTPGLTLTDPRPIPRDDLGLLLSGLTESVQGFSALPFVGEELAAIESLYGGTRLENNDFVLSRLESELDANPYSIVHFATHGEFQADVRDTFVLTFDGKLSLDRLEDLMGITSVRPKPVELLTLSACQTAAGDDRAALGLAGLAVKAGARSALATLWRVNDRASSLLVSEFYRQLRDPSLSKARALQRAQVAVLSSPDLRRYRRPFYWSPFLLIGNWL